VAIFFTGQTLITKSFELFENCQFKSKKIGKILNSKKNSLSIDVVDLSDLEVTGEDGLHFSVEDHHEVAKRVFNIIKKYAQK
jgi:hypothetical protein